MRIRLRDGTALWAAVSGTGPPAVFLHGGPGMWDYLAPLAALLEDTLTVVRYDQRGCGRSAGGGPFTIAQAVGDLDEVRAALGLERWAVAGHSWGAELALRYAARHPRRVTAVAYLAGAGSGDAYRDPYEAGLRRRLGDGFSRMEALDAIPAAGRTLEQERERCLLHWEPDYSPGPAAAGHARDLWDSRPPGAVVNETANRQLWGDRHTEPLDQAAARVTAPVTMIFGADDPRPAAASDSVLAALPRATRAVLDGAGHAPWTEQPAAVRALLLTALRGSASSP